MMVTWSGFHPYVLPEVIGVPVPALDHAIRNAAIEFCEETLLHVVDAAPIDVLAGVSTYPLSSGNPELDVCLVKAAWFNERQLPCVSQEVLNEQVPDYWPSKTAEQPTCFTQQDQDNLILYPVPTQDALGALRLKLVVRPSLASTGVADWIGKRFIQEISYGAISMLAGMSNKPWTNPATETKYRALFESGKTKATVDAYRSFTRAHMTVQIPRF